MSDPTVKKVDLIPHAIDGVAIVIEFNDGSTYSKHIMKTMTRSDVMAVLRTMASDMQRQIAAESFRPLPDLKKGKDNGKHN
jgi:hypothetical protein